MKGRPLTPTVKRIGQIHFEGNVIPHTWYRHVTLPTGKPDLLGITILAEVVYWYRPEVLLDEQTKHPVGAARRFTEDKLQYSYEQIAQKFGVSKRQAKRAMDRLVELGLMTTEFRTVSGKGGVPQSNVLYLEPVPETVARISDVSNTGRGSYQNRHPLLPNLVGGGAKNGKTYTEITSETTSEKERSRAGAPSAPVGARGAPAGALGAPARAAVETKIPRKRPVSVYCRSEQRGLVELRLDLRGPLTHYYGRNPSPSDIKQLRLQIQMTWNYWGYRYTQDDLDGIALRARAYLEEHPEKLNKCGTAIGYHIFRDELATFGHAILDRRDQAAARLIDGGPSR